MSIEHLEGFVIGLAVLAIPAGLELRRLRALVANYRAICERLSARNEAAEKGYIGNVQGMKGGRPDG